MKKLFKLVIPSCVAATLFLTGAAFQDTGKAKAAGENNPTGTLPVTIYNQDGSVLYDFGHGLGY